MTFDPYNKWLGIPADKRPPTHYQLLGISPDETDPDAIEATVLQRVAYVRHYQTGPHADHANRLLNEISDAAHTLRDPEMRRQYDAKLHRLHRAQGSGILTGGRRNSLLWTFSIALLSPLRFIAWLFELEEDRTEAGSGPSIFRRPLLTFGFLALGIAIMVGSLWLPWTTLDEDGKSDRIWLPWSVKPATYIVELEPANARLRLEGDGVTMTGTGEHREISIASPDGRTPVLLVASLPGHQEVQRELRPMSGETGAIQLRLLPLGDGSIPEFFAAEQEQRIGSPIPDFFKPDNDERHPASPIPEFFLPDSPSPSKRTEVTGKDDRLPDFFSDEPAPAAGSDDGNLPGFFKDD